MYMKNGELYVVEVKPLKERGSVKLSDNKNSPNNIGVQMTNEWIISRANELANSKNSPTAKATGNKILQAVEGGKPINKIVVGVNDSRAVTINLGNKVSSK
ncbi:TPA: hypothetical protein U2N26_001329 [Acinetobacter nosocomialis]|nr:hypothetical protein [Acinetobacter nosocomialis]HEM7378046.1 hypothetical protein [Acinetobacter nosocomialis]HEM8427030.1 hypothetical protein [Acinetobacter nosocomialis]